MNQQLVDADLRHQLFKSLQLSTLDLTLPPALQVSPWAAMSLLQKAIRRGETEWALAAASTLLKQSPQKLWRRLAVIAFEDIGQGDHQAIGHTLAATSSKASRGQLVGDEKVAALIIRMQCDAAKCRAADDLALICDWIPDLEECRVNFAESQVDELAAVVADTRHPLPHRAIALWYLFGIDRLRSKNLAVRKGGIDAGLEALGALSIPATILEFARLGIQRGAGTLAAFYPLLWHDYVHDTGEVLKVTNLPKPTVMAGSVPSYVYDLHVREGRTAIKRFLQSDCATARWAAAANSTWGQQELVFGMVFRKESAYLGRWLMWSTGNSLSDQTDWDVHGVTRAQLEEGYALLEADMDLLHQLRREVVGSC